MPKVSVKTLGCLETNWHATETCGFDDIRLCYQTLVVVDDCFQPMPVEVKHPVNPKWHSGASRPFFLANFRLRDAIGHEVHFH